MASKNAITIPPYANVRKMSVSDFWDMLKAEQDRHDEYTYTLLSNITDFESNIGFDFDVVYTTVYDEKRTTTLYAFCGNYLARQLEVDGVAIVLQHCNDFDTLLVIEK